MTAVREYKDKFTLDGRVKMVPGVTETKVRAVKTLLEKHYAGDRIATATLHEALTTSDAIFNMAYLATMNFIPQYDLAPRVWTTVAGTRPVPDFRPATLYSLNRTWTDGNGGSDVLSKDIQGAAPIIPEGSAYPYAYISGLTAEGGSVVKRGFKTDWTLESRINDALGAIEQLPSEMLEVSLDTEEADVFGALVAQATTTLAGGTVPSGVVVPANAPFSRDAVIQAIVELANRTIGGRRIQVTGGYNLVVPVGQKPFVDFVLNQAYLEVQNGAYVLNVSGYNPLADVSVVESIYVTGTIWYLIPKPGATKRPVLERLSLRGYETPQLFVENLTGNFVGGGSVSPFEGSFNADVITLKLRQFGGGVVWDSGTAVVKSTGAGS